VPGGVLLHAAAGVVERGGTELHDVEGVQYRGGVLELVADGVVVAVERLQGGGLDARPERLGSGGDPVGVGASRAPRHQVQQPGVHPALGVAGQIHHPGQLLGTPPAGLDRLGAHVVPDVFIHPKTADPVEAGFVGGHLLQQRCHRRPQGPPAGAELAGQAGDAGVLAAQLGQRPPPGPPRQQPPRRGHLLVLLGEHPHRARRHQVRLRQRTRTGRPNAGASIRVCTRRPWLAATALQSGHPTNPGADSTVAVNRGRPTSTATTCSPSKPRRT